jgi:hypothetical protein
MDTNILPKGDGYQGIPILGACTVVDPATGYFPHSPLAVSTEISISNNRPVAIGASGRKQMPFKAEPSNL